MAGYKPFEDNLVLSAGADWIETLPVTAGSPPWPAGATGHVRFFDADKNVILSPPVEVDGMEVRVRVEAEDLEAVPVSGATWALHIAVPHGLLMDDFVWRFGRVSWVPRR